MSIGQTTGITVSDLEIDGPQGEDIPTYAPQLDLARGIYIRLTITKTQEFLKLYEGPGFIAGVEQGECRNKVFGFTRGLYINNARFLMCQ